MGPKDAPCEHPSPTKTSAPAPSAFIFPPRRSHFPRMAFGLPPNDVRPCRSNVHTSAPSFTFPPHTLRRRPRRLRPPAAVVIHNGLSTEKLSTSLLAALCKTCSPSRLRTRIYNISFVRRPLPGVSVPLWGRGRAVVIPCPAPPSAGWGRAKAKADAPSRSNPHFPRLRPCPCRLCAESLCAKAECTRQSPPLWPRGPRRRAQGGGGRRQRRTPPRAVPRTFPAYGRAPVRLPPRPRRLNGHPASAGGRENDRMAHRRTATPTHRTPRGNDTCTIRVPRRKGAQSVVHNL